ncbi:MAG TPA: hypothetical protein VLV31_08260, partial [Candidatus Acidoferrales bacterium]|nr:hypothetical protein [Candidatus Acidoferrales bacterium]
MGKGASGQCRCWSRILLASLLEAVILLSTVLVNTPSILPTARAQPSSSVGSILPAKYPLLFGSNGNIEIDIPKPGIAVRIEIPREFLQNLGALGSWPLENDTRFVTSNIRNDYYYYNLVDESKHWTYDWHDNASDGPCFKPNFSYYDSNAPYCLEIWNYLTSPLQYSPTSVTPILKQPDRTILCPLGAIPYDSATPCPSNYFDHTLFPDHTFNYTYLVGVDYCQSPNVDKYVFECFNPSSSAPKFVLLHNLISPTLAGVYNFTLSVTNRTNWLGYPDFVHAWNTTLQVPVSMAYNAGYIAGNIC